MTDARPLTEPYGSEKRKPCEGCRQRDEQIARLAEEVRAALDTLEDVLNQACYGQDGEIDSGALSSYADGLRFMAEHGRFKIEREAGRMVVGRWIEPAPEPRAGGET